MSEWRYDEDRGQWQAPIEDGCIWHPNYVNHRRGRNWIATVNKNLKAPGGLERVFWRKASGRHYMVPDGLTIGNYIEVGGDYYTASGRPDRKREYYQVKEIWSQAIWLEPIAKKEVGKKAAEPDITLKSKRLIDLGNSGEPLQGGENGNIHT